MKNASLVLNCASSVPYSFLRVRHHKNHYEMSYGVSTN